MKENETSCDIQYKCGFKVNTYVSILLDLDLTNNTS